MTNCSHLFTPKPLLIAMSTIYNEMMQCTTPETCLNVTAPPLRVDSVCHSTDVLSALGDLHSLVG